MNKEKIHKQLQNYITCLDGKKNTILELSHNTKDKVLENFAQDEKYLIEHTLFTEKRKFENANYTKSFQADIDLTSSSSFQEYHAKFDYILSKNFFEYLRYPTQNLIDYKSLLNPNGNFIFSFPNISHISMKAKLLQNSFSYDNDTLLQEDNIHLFTYKTIAEMLAHASLIIEECSFLVLDEVTNNFDSYFSNIPIVAIKPIINDLNSYASHYVIKSKAINADIYEIFQFNYKTLVLTDKNAPSEIQMQKITLLKELHNKIASA